MMRDNRYLSFLGALALSFGYAVGWGAFVMPGTTFLPSAGPLGTVIGVFFGALAMGIFAINYHRLTNRYSGPGARQPLHRSCSAKTTASWSRGSSG